MRGYGSTEDVTHSNLTAFIPVTSGRRTSGQTLSPGFSGRAGRWRAAHKGSRHVWDADKRRARSGGGRSCQVVRNRLAMTLTPGTNISKGKTEHKSL